MAGFPKAGTTVEIGHELESLPSRFPVFERPSTTRARAATNGAAALQRLRSEGDSIISRLFTTQLQRKL